MRLVGTPRTGDLVVPQDKGYLVLGTPLPGQSQAVTAARLAFEALVAEGRTERELNSANKRFLVGVLGDRDLLDHPDIFRFAISRPVADLAARYLGRVPILSALRIWWTPTNATVESSQHFHLDGEGRKQLKLFFNITPVGPDAGPLTIIPADTSESESRRRQGLEIRSAQGSSRKVGGAEEQPFPLTFEHPCRSQGTAAHPLFHVAFDTR